RLGGRERDRILARRAFSRVLYRDPLNGRAYLERAKLARAFEQWDSAVEDARSATRVDPFAPDGWVLLGKLFGGELPKKSDPATQRPVSLRQGARPLSSATAWARVGYSGEAYGLALMLGETRRGAWEELIAGATALDAEVAPVFSGASVPPEQVERAI